MNQKPRSKHKCPKCGERYLVRSGKTAGGKQRWTCKMQRTNGSGENRGEYQDVICYTTTDPAAPYRDQGGRSKKKAQANLQFRKKLGGVRRLLITAAQNATPSHPGLQAMKVFCKANDAELVVIPYRYKNATSVWTESQANAEWWTEEVQPHLFNQRKKINSNLMLLADIPTQPTTIHPLTSVEGHTMGESGILGHAQAAMRCVPTPQDRLPKILMTTGSCTVPNYSATARGKLGEFNHVIGACYVEIESDKKFHLHRINCRKDGAFIHHEWAYYPNGDVLPAGPVQAMVFGDAHFRFADPVVVKATFGKGGLVDVLDPKVLVFHDLLDGYSCSPHHDHDPLVRIAKHRAGFDEVQREVVETVNWLVEVSQGRKTYVVPSNHDDMLSRWVKREDWKKDQVNAEFYLEMALAMVRSARMTDTGASYLDPFPACVDKFKGPGADHIRCLTRQESLRIAEVDLGNHGDKGPNGARGTVRNLAKIGTKIMTGHGHSPEEEKGHSRVGTMTRLTAEYTFGPGSWLNTHGTIDAFNKRHLHHIIDGRFRA